jgi:hypothetical protein
MSQYPYWLRLIEMFPFSSGGNSVASENDNGCCVVHEFYYLPMDSHVWQLRFDYIPVCGWCLWTLQLMQWVQFHCQWSYNLVQHPLPPFKTKSAGEKAKVSATSSTGMPGAKSVCTRSEFQEGHGKTAANQVCFLLSGEVHHPIGLSTPVQRQRHACSILHLDYYIC